MTTATVQKEISMRVEEYFQIELNTEVELLLESSAVTARDLKTSALSNLTIARTIGFQRAFFECWGVHIEHLSYDRAIATFIRGTHPTPAIQMVIAEIPVPEPVLLVKVSNLGSQS